MKRVPRLVRADDFVAESPENEAAKMPPSAQAQADNLRAAAKRFRESGRPGMLRLWENADGDDDFIHPDPVSARFPRSTSLAAFAASRGTPRNRPSIAAG
jgi:hypothetical protein